MLKIDESDQSISGQKLISIIMPTYNQGAFIRRAIASLLAQTLQDWELIIINDGSDDYTNDVIEDFLCDSRVRCYNNDENRGLGYCLNQGIRHAKHDYICYLPSDDIYYTNHLASLLDRLVSSDDAVLSYSGLYYSNSDNYINGLSTKKTDGIIPEHSLQLVQVMHKRSLCKWVERDTFVTSDLDKMFWEKLHLEGEFISTNVISCEWVSHPLQRHKIISKKYGGGLSFYRNYYHVRQSLKFCTDDGTCIDEQATKQRQIRVEPGKLKILIVGELGFNPERLTAFEQMGHQLFSLWIPNPDIHNSVGPFSFGNIIDINIEDLEKQITEINPDIIYAMLNTQAVKLAHYVMLSNPDIPFVWHFKEGPFFCRNSGIWKDLFELYYNADGRIYINQQCKDWYEQFIGDKNRPTYIMDGDLPPEKWFTGNQSPLLSKSHREIHTVMPGRPYGITPSDIKVLAGDEIHLHLYGEFYHTKWKNWVDNTQEQASGYLHLHPHCEPENWVKEFSQYDAGWLHCFESKNNGELMRCSWDDLNYPARMSTLAAAGLPMIQRNNSGHRVATQSLLEKLNIGILFSSFDDLTKQLHNKSSLNATRKNVYEHRALFTFDHYVNELIDFFYNVIKIKKSG